ncbi:MAG TPA: Gfo/Idh/MocA family oxidoreductase [Candidatus Acidoferrales bacterium]|nr:Gfo/Idh/MocA family oxidoreductase [Candidatus Acidoferrales bacterium]
MHRISLAVVGLGNAFVPHAKSLQDLADRVSVHWAASPSPERTRTVAEQFGFPVTNDVDQAIMDPAVEAVLLLTPPSTHPDLTRRCLESGKHVLLEKPLACSLEDAESIVADAKRFDRRLGVVLQHRFRPGSMRLHDLVRAGALGKIQAASMSVPWWRAQGYYDEPGRGTIARDGGGVLITQAIHTLDLFRSLVGISEVVAAQAITTNLHRMECEDYATALVRLGAGGPGTIVATTAAYPGRPERIDIIGSLGTASLVGGALQVCFLDGTVEQVLSEERTGGGADPMDFPHGAHRAVLSDFLDAIESGREPSVSGSEALATQRVIAEILERSHGQLAR